MQNKTSNTLYCIIIADLNTDFYPLTAKYPLKYEKNLIIFFQHAKIFNNKVGYGVSFVATSGLLASCSLELPDVGAWVGFGVAVRGSWGLAE